MLEIEQTCVGRERHVKESKPNPSKRDDNARLFSDSEFGILDPGFGTSKTPRILSQLVAERAPFEGAPPPLEDETGARETRAHAGLSRLSGACQISRGPPQASASQSRRP